MKSFYGSIAVKNHQYLSFSKHFAKIEPGEKVFWPGCAVMSLGPELVLQTFELMQTLIPNLSLSSFCCGKPSKFISEGEPYTKRQQLLSEQLEQAGTKVVYVLCPNCYLTLGELEGIEVRSAWEVINEAFPEKQRNVFKGKKLALHDPCVAQYGMKDYEIIREILVKMGIEIQEFPKNREKSNCCGNRNMTLALRPELGKKILESRTAEAPSE